MKIRCLFGVLVRAVLSIVLAALYVTTLPACADRVQTLGTRSGIDAGSDAGAVDRVQVACAGERNRVLYACNVSNELLYAGTVQARLAQVAFYSCGVRVTPRMVQLVLGRDPFPGGSGFHGLIMGSNGTNYFPNMVVLDAMRGRVVPHRIVEEYDDSRTFRIEPTPIAIEGGEARIFFVVADLADREDRPWEFFGPLYRVGITPWFGSSITPEGIEITDYATGTRIPEAWIREAGWSDGCLVPRGHFEVARPSVRVDAGR